MTEPEKSDGGVSAGLAEYARMTAEPLGGVIAGAGSGYALDRVFGTLPWFLLLGFFLGAGAGLWLMKRAIDRIAAESEKSDKQVDKGGNSATTPGAH